MPRTRARLTDAGTTPRSLTRRDALRLLIGAGASAALAPEAALAQTTQEKLDAAQLSYDQAQEELERISGEYEAIAGEVSATTAQIADVSQQIDEKQGQIDETQGQIDETQGKIDEKQIQMEDRQGVLGKRMSSSYKAGPLSTLDLLLSSTTFDELTSNIYYLDKVNEADAEMIEEIRTLREELEADRAELEDQKAALEGQKDELETTMADLEALQADQREQLDEARAKQAESQELVANLSDEVQQLMEQRDAEEYAELLAAQQLAQQMQQQGGVPVSGPVEITGSGPLASVVRACYTTPSPGTGLCAAWVTYVFANAGVGSFYGNADDMYYAWCRTSPSNIQPGMIIAVNTSPSSAAGRIYGHIGIYIGNGTVMDNIGYIRTTSLSYWVSYYSALATPLCGWLGGVALS